MDIRIGIGQPHYLSSCVRHQQQARNSNLERTKPVASLHAISPCSCLEYCKSIWRAYWSSSADEGILGKEAILPGYSSRHMTNLMQVSELLYFETRSITSLVRKKDQRLTSSQCFATFSKSKSSPMGIPQPASNTSCIYHG